MGKTKIKGSSFKGYFVPANKNMGSLFTNNPDKAIEAYSKRKMKDKNYNEMITKVYSE